MPPPVKNQRPRPGCTAMPYKGTRSYRAVPPLLGAKAPRSNPFNAGKYAPCGGLLGRLRRGFPTWAPLTGRALSVRPSVVTPPASAPVTVWRFYRLGGLTILRQSRSPRSSAWMSASAVAMLVANGNIVHVAQTQKPRLVGLAGLRADRIAEKEQQVDLVAGDARRDLLVAALRTRPESGRPPARSPRRRAFRSCRSRRYCGG